MSKVSIDIEHLALKRLDKKLWQYENNKPKRVELAVLDYLQKKGWQGYFSEDCDYDQIILCMMCWCNRESYFKEKRKSLRVESLNKAFDLASDGYWQSDRHKFSHADLINHARNFEEDAIPRILNTWRQRGIKSHLVWQKYTRKRMILEYRYPKNQSTYEIQPDRLIYFFKARGGLHYYLNYLDHVQSVNFQKLKERARNNHVTLKKIHGAYGKVPLRDLAFSAGSHLGMYHENDELHEVDANNSLEDRRLHRLENWIQKIQELEGEELYSDVLSLATDIKDYWIKQNSKMSNFQKFADLDLVVWKDTVVSVEVKAPNDRLQPHQKEQLKLDGYNGIKSWVIEVHDGQIDNRIKGKKRQILFDDEKFVERLAESQEFQEKPIFHPDKSWQKGLEILQNYVKSTGSTLAPQGLIFQNFKLGQWVATQRVQHSKNKLKGSQEEALNDLGFIWNVNDHTWLMRYNSYLKYIKETGDTQVPKGLMFEGFNLSKWASKQREAYYSGVIQPDRKRLLNDIGFSWRPVTGHHNARRMKFKDSEKSKASKQVSLSKMPWEP